MPNNKKQRRTTKNKGRSNGSAFPDRVLPVFHSSSNSSNSRSATSEQTEQKGGIYEIYKTATNAFVEWVKSTRSKKPSSKFTVADLADRALQIDTFNLGLDFESTSVGEKKTPIVAPGNIMQDLEVSIQYRQIMAGKHGDHEEGHAYFIKVLKQFRKVLRRGQRVAQIMNDEESSPSEDVKATNRYRHLEDEDDEQEEDDEQSITQEHLRQRSIPAVQIPQAPEKIPSLEDLIAGSDRMQAVALLVSMESLMEEVEKSYLAFQAQRSGANDDASDLQGLLQCGMVANFATVSVRVMENSLQLDHPHLSSWYHIMSKVFLNDHIHEFNCFMPQKIRDEKPFLGLDFVAEVMAKAVCGNILDEKRLQKYTQKAGITTSSSLDALRNAVHASVVAETMLESKERYFAQQFGNVWKMNRTWLNDKKCIGRDRSIVNTIALAQRAFERVSGEGRLVGKPGSFGPQFDETIARAAYIRGPLDDVFASTILPELIGLGKWAPFHFWPEVDRLAPTMDLLSIQSKHSTAKPVKLALAFGLHAMLTSILVLQGDLQSLAVTSKQSFHKLFDQWQPMLSRSNGGSEHSPNFYMNLSKFSLTQKFGMPVPSGVTSVSTSESVEHMALWNPFIGSQYLLFATYMCSIGVGSAMIDDVGQLRTTLHLYHSLKTSGLLSGPIQFLETLLRVFGGTKRLWATREPPNKGSFVKAYLLSFGASIDVANRLSSTMVLDGKAIRKARLGKIRSVDEISPQDFSESYLRLVMADFSLKDAGETVEQSERKPNRKDFNTFLSHVDITREAMIKDASTVLPINFPVVSDILLGFVSGLADRLNWGSRISEITAADQTLSPHATEVTLKHQAIIQLVAREILADQDKDSTSSLCQETVDFMNTYFEGITRDQYTFTTEPR